MICVLRANATASPMPEAGGTYLLDPCMAAVGAAKARRNAVAQNGGMERPQGKEAETAPTCRSSGRCLFPVLAAAAADAGHPFREPLAGSGEVGVPLQWRVAGGRHGVNREPGSAQRGQLLE